MLLSVLTVKLHLKGILTSEEVGKMTSVQALEKKLSSRGIISGLSPKDLELMQEVRGIIQSPSSLYTALSRLEGIVSRAEDEVIVTLLQRLIQYAKDIVDE
jgi:hypothetical protein